MILAPIFTSLLFIILFSCCTLSLSLSLSLPHLLIFGKFHNIDGAFWCLNPCLVMEMYGSKSFGSLYSVMNVAPAIGSTVFSVGLASYVYGYHEEEGENCCLGQACYQVVIMMVMVMMMMMVMFNTESIGS